MKHRVLWGVTALAVAAMVAAMVGCEDSGLTAPTDGLITLTVNPSAITIDPNAGQTEGTATVIATVFRNDGRVLEGINVLFSSKGGSLASGSTPVKTDANGIARDTLTVTINDPEIVQVTVQSSSIIQTADVDVVVVGADELPRAAIFDLPQGEQEVGKVVTFDGSASVDPDGTITCYQWVIDSDLNANDEIIQGPGASGVQRTYGEEQTLAVLLRVSDRADAGAQCIAGGTPVPESLFSPFIATLVYTITCANTPPVADAGPDQTGVIPLGQSSKVVELDGTRSSDPDGTIDRYVWSCGDGSAPVQIVAPGIVRCAYRSPGSFEASLTVFDNGDGTTDPFGQFNCQKQAADTALITITRESP